MHHLVHTMLLWAHMLYDSVQSRFETGKALSMAPIKHTHPTHRLFESDPVGWGLQTFQRMQPASPDSCEVVFIFKDAGAEYVSLNGVVGNEHLGEPA